MAFMKPEITEKMKWAQVDGPCGLDTFPAELLGALTRARIEMSALDDAAMIDDVLDEVRTYSQGTIWSIEIVEGYGARLSAPGYMDCTSWAVFDTEDEASQYLKEMFGDDEESE